MNARYVLGAAAENAVADFLVQQDYSIIGRNLRLGRFEVDLVAIKGEVVAIVEVRYRGQGAWCSGFGSIDSRKRARIRSAGERLWAQRFKNDRSVSRLRFDAAVVEFTPDGPVVRYAEAAF